MSEPDLTLLRGRAINDANQLVIDHGVFTDAEKIEKLADLVERCNFAPAYSEILVAELRARAAFVTAMQLMQQEQPHTEHRSPTVILCTSDAGT